MLCWSGGLPALSFPVAARLAECLERIDTMVVTHVPSSPCLIAAACARGCRTWMCRRARDA
jgi:hypothetical protein